MSKTNAEKEEAKRLEAEQEAKRLAAEEEAKRNTLIDDFVNAKLTDTRIVRRPELNIAGKKMKFDVGTNNILYDVDITEEEFNEKVKFLHPVDSQDASGIKFQYRVVKKVDGKYVTVFKSDSFVESGKVKRNNIKREV